MNELTPTAKVCVGALTAGGAALFEADADGAAPAAASAACAESASAVPAGSPDACSVAATSDR
ncbi:hypothetical protein ACFPIJ_05970 [Dactylosporangium cerinum]|uniref:Uncharacterized protein n=1 Tax=Dactylosporangium cerinum TaxID=1434730 RepID=A0ABV9VP46_9ACTN